MTSPCLTFIKSVVVRHLFDPCVTGSGKVIAECSEWLSKVLGMNMSSLVGDL